MSVEHQAVRSAKADRLGVDTAAPSAWSPFAHGAFTVLWTAAVVSAIGTWMHDVAAGWLMTSLAPSPLMVALVQAATTLPVFLFALPAGALADIVNRRRMLTVVVLALAAITLTLALLVQSGRMTPWLLLALTLASGTGAAFASPAWQAVIPQLVPRAELQSAVSLISVGSNIARAVGPAIGGVLIGVLGISIPFFFNAIAFCGVAAALIWWRPRTFDCHDLPPEHMGGAIRSGLRYAFASQPLRDTLVRSVAFFIFASASWALLPLIARQLLGGGPELYGLLQAAIGVGAVACAFNLPRMKQMLGPNRLVALGTVAAAAAMVIFAALPYPPAAIGAAAIAGAAWIAVLSSLNTSAQLALPEWVRGRGLSIFLMIFYGAMALGSVIWGRTAEEVGIPATLLIAAAGAVAAAVLSWPFKLYRGEALDMTPSMHWPLPVERNQVEPDRGPVLVTVRYQVPEENREDFLSAMHERRLARLRNGAMSWSIYEDVSAPASYIETFTDVSWLDHLRHHDRVTKSEKAIEERVRALNGTGYPQVTHYVMPKRGG